MRGRLGMEVVSVFLQIEFKVEVNPSKQSTSIHLFLCS